MTTGRVCSTNIISIYFRLFSPFYFFIILSICTGNEALMFDWIIPRYLIETRVGFQVNGMKISHGTKRNFDRLVTGALFMTPSTSTTINIYYKRWIIYKVEWIEIADWIDYILRLWWMHACVRCLRSQHQSNHNISAGLLNMTWMQPDGTPHVAVYTHYTCYLWMADAQTMLLIPAECTDLCWTNRVTVEFEIKTKCYDHFNIVLVFIFAL